MISMIKLWIIVHYLESYPRNGYWANRNDTIEHSKFRFYILHSKLFLEDIRDTFGDRLVMRIFPELKRKSNQVVVDRMTDRLKKIDDLIDKAISKGYLTTIGVSLNQKLSINWQGKDFLKPTYFIESSLKEFGQTSVVILTLLTSGIISFIVSNWDRIITFIK